jgi:hypothetical protein
MDSCQAVTAIWAPTLSKRGLTSDAHVLQKSKIWRQGNLEPVSWYEFLNSEKRNISYRAPRMNFTYISVVISYPKKCQFTLVLSVNYCNILGVTNVTM